MKSAVFFIQNQTTFSSPCAHPNCHPKKRDASTEDPRVAQSICGTASTHAAAANTTQGRQTSQTLFNIEGRSPSSTPSLPASAANTTQPCNSARHAPIDIITTKLCACTSGKSPATNPAASIGRKAKGRRQKAKVLSAVASLLASSTACDPRDARPRSARLRLTSTRAALLLPLTFFFPPTPRLPTSASDTSGDEGSSSLPTFAFCLLPSAFTLASHQSVQTMSASERPRSMLRCVTKSVVTALPHW